MKIGQIVLFYDRRGEAPVPGIVTLVHDSDRVNLKTIPDGDEPMRFQPNVPRRIDDAHGYSFECADSHPKAAVAAKKKVARKR